MPLTYDIVIESGPWPQEDALSALLARIAAIIPAEKSASVTCVFSDDANIQRLNHAFRGQDKPTNVLSFPDGETHDGRQIHLGDVVVAHATLTREAQRDAKSFDDHLAHLLVHGTLHLMGHDHETDDQANTMESLETAILLQLGIKNPYQDADQALN